MIDLVDLLLAPKQTPTPAIPATVPTDSPIPHIRVDDSTVIAGITPDVWRRWLAMYAAGGDHRRRLAFEIVSPAYNYYIADIWPLLERHAGTCKHTAQPGCITRLHQLLDDPKQIREVERYMARYPWFDYADVPARLAQLKHGT